MNKKYVKVSVSERLPEKSGNYFVFISDHDVPNGEFMHTREFNLNENRFTRTPFPVKSFLEEVPDHSGEMLSLLEDVKLFFQPHPHFAFTDDQESTLNQIEKLINKVKDNGK